jgi:two-component system cell cycle sensor histidine kinase/response regulator CckA
MKRFVLIVEDEEHIRIVFHDALHDIGVPVVGAPSGEAGVELYRRHKDDVSLVVLDLSLPGMSGEETFKQLQAINPNVKVVVSSGFPHEDVTKKFGGTGVAGYLQKPYNWVTLTETMGKFLGGDASR